MEGSTPTNVPQPTCAAADSREPTAESRQPKADCGVIPISADLWQRLKRFDRLGGFEISLIRTVPMNKTSWAEAGYKRVWVVTIRPMDRLDWANQVQCIHPTLTEALRAAVEECERRGWECVK